MSTTHFTSSTGIGAHIAWQDGPRAFSIEGRHKPWIAVCMDYCFITDENEEGNLYPILLTYDDRLKSIRAMPVERRGHSHG